VHQTQYTGGTEWSAIIAVLSNVINNWLDFEAFCLRCGGIDPLEIPSRRLVAAAWAFLTENMDPEDKEKLIYNLTTEETRPTKRSTSATSPSSPGEPIPYKGKWRAPEGWTPPGWNDELSYKESVSFMGFNANPK